MAWTSKQILLSLLLVFTGSINTISTKWADSMKAVGSDKGEPREFDHPFVQACCMFFGEFLCLICFKILYYIFKRKQDGTEEENALVRGNREFSPFVLMPAAMCDMVATSLMYIGLNLTYPSSFQMLRGSVIIFVALLSVAFLHRSITPKMWVGIAFVITGLTVVGISDFLLNSLEKKDTNSQLTGDLLIVAAQIIVAVQMVYEEKFVSDKDIPPLQAVGWEGTFGLVVLGLLLFPFYFIHVPEPFSSNAHGVLEDLPDALAQMMNNKLLFLAILGTVISIAFFNFAGISVTKELSATTRMVLDSVRILVIYLFSLAVHWQGFHPLQILGFLLLLIGMAVYNNLLPDTSVIRRAFPRERDDALVPNES